MGKGQDPKKESEKQVSPNVSEQEGKEKVFFVILGERREILFVAKYIKMLI